MGSISSTTPIFFLIQQFFNFTTHFTTNFTTNHSDVALVPVVQCDRHVCDNTQSNTGCGLLPDDGDIQVTGNNGVHIPHSIPKGITKITKLTLELFDNNYHLYAQKINHPKEGLFIRAIIMKNNAIFFNHTYKIIGTSNVAIATIASADQVCNHYLVHADKGDTFICALGDSHNGVQNYIIRNVHLAKFHHNFECNQSQNRPIHYCIRPQI